MATVSLPRLLEPAAGDRLQLAVEGDTVGTVVSALLSEMPTLRVHLFDGGLRLRPHVLCFVDGVSSRLDQPDQPVLEELRFVQAVSGG
jgi:hypothetical protein